MKLDAVLRASQRATPFRAEQQSPVSFFEFWPAWLFYTPVVVHWIALGLRYRDMLLPTAANPRIEAGGLCGESKTDILDQAGPFARGADRPLHAHRDSSLESGGGQGGGRGCAGAGRNRLPLHRQARHRL